MTVREQAVRNPAGFWIRLVAAFLDNLLVYLPLTVVVGLLFGNPYEDNVSSLILSALSLLYALLLPVIWNGYTVGKRILGIRIAKVSGEKLGLGAMFMRTVVGGLVYGITFGLAALISALMVGLRRDKRALHDFLAGTYVTRD